MSSTASAAVGGRTSYEDHLRHWISDEKLERIGSRTTIVGLDALRSDPSKSKPELEVRLGKDGENNVIWIEWSGENDSDNPFNWSTSKKWTTTLICCCFTSLVALVGTSYAISTASMIRDLNCSSFLSTMGLSAYPLGFGLAPLVFAPFSEEFGRYKMYSATSFLFCVFFLPIALAPDINLVIFFRFLLGVAGSSGSTLVGGSIADLFVAADRGPPMACFSIFAFVGSGLGPVLFGYVEMDSRLGWRMVNWIQMVMAGLIFIAILLFTKETRGSVILSRKAAALRNLTGENWRCRSDNGASLLALVKVSLTRPIYLIFTEAIVFSFSLWAGVAWGVLYLTLEVVGEIMNQVYDFNIGEAGLSFGSICVAGLIGGLLNIYQERLYTKYAAKRGPEARLFGAMAGGILLPTGIFIFAFTQGRTGPATPILGLVLLFTGIFTIYLAVFNYLADCYTIYASSALAGQSLFRNLAGFGFPLFTPAMYAKLGYQWASALAGLISLLVTFTPFVLFLYGPQIRAKSQFAKQLAKMSR